MNRLRKAGQYVIALGIIYVVMTLAWTVGLALYSLLPDDPNTGIPGIVHGLRGG